VTKATQRLAWSPRLGAHLEASRKQAGLRRSDLAGQLGVSEETIRLWERGAVQPSATYLQRLVPLLSIEAAAWPSRRRTADDLPPLARRLWNERSDRGSTQVEVAALLGVPQATYSGWETGRTTPSARHHPALARLMGVTEADVATLASTPFLVDTAGWPPFGQFVGARRQELRLTRAHLAEAVGVTPHTVATWELGHRSPGSRQLPKLAEALSVEITSLVAMLPRRAPATQLGRLIEERQRELGLRAGDLARRLGTTETTISRWVHGRNRPVPANLRRLAEVLEVEPAAVRAALSGAG